MCLNTIKGKEEKGEFGLCALPHKKKEAREAINQTLESATRQYRRNVQGLVAERDSRRNQIQSQINRAYNQIPSLSSVILGAASQGLSTFASVGEFG